MSHSLTLGSLLLTGDFADATYDYSFSVLADGLGFGVAAGVREVVTSLLSDGDLIRTSRYGNREVSFVVEITGPDLASLAHGEAALRREIGRGNTLTWQPPDDFAVPTVFEVVASEMAQRFDDLDELGKRRKFTLTLTCAPWARSRDAIVVSALAAPPVSPTTYTVNGADTTTGWSATLNGYTTTGGITTSNPVVDLGLDGVSTSGNGFTLILAYTASSPESLAGTGYLTVELGGTAPTHFGILYSGAPYLVTAALVVIRALPNGNTSYVFAVDSSKSLARFEVQIHTDAPIGEDRNLTLNAFDVSRTDTLPVVTKRQISRIIEGRGTERTPGSIKVSSPTSSPLGHTIVHTCPEDGSGYSPPLRRWRYDGNDPVTTEAARFSGAYEATEPDPFIAMVPNSALPHGDYLLVARLYSTAAGPVDVSVFAGAIVNSEGLGGDVETITVNFPAAGWYTFPLRVLSLPTIRSLGPTTQINISTSSSDGVTTQIDEGWLFRMGDDCGLTIVNNPTKNLWLDSPDISSGVPRVWVGNISDGSDQRHPAGALQSFGSHIISPEGTALFTAAEVDNPTASAQFYPRWHSNAAS